MLPKEIIDNTKNNKLVDALKKILTNFKSKTFDVASAFFEINAYKLIKDELGSVDTFRLLLGQVPKVESEDSLEEFLKEEVMTEVKNAGLDKEKDDAGSEFIDFLKNDNVEVRLYKKGFLHGKAYIFDDYTITGSSNFTTGGLTREGELNQFSAQSKAEYVRVNWFNKFWDLSNDYKEELIELLESLRFGSNEYTPYEIFIKSLYEFQKEDIKLIVEGEGKKDIKTTTVNLAEFQSDALSRIYSRLDKYGAILVADSVGLGKTHIALKVIEKFTIKDRSKVLVISPAQIKELVWKRELQDKILSAGIVSQEEIGSADFLDKVKESLGGNFDNLDLIVVDESHNFRNPLSNRWENLFSLISEHLQNNKPKILFLTATPINNSSWDLYWQLKLMLINDNGFLKENIPDMYEFFKDAENNQKLLNDLLNEISIRRTRDYITKNYPDAYIGDNPENKIKFPERILENINYSLDKSYKGMYKEISDIISNKLKMPYYKLLEYRKTPLSGDEAFELGRMVSIGGLFQTMLLKRLESSTESFKISVSRQISFLETFKKSLDNNQFFSKKNYNKLFKNFEKLSDEDIGLFFSKNEDIFENFDKNNYHYNDLISDLDNDIKLFKKIHEKVNDIKPEDDAKLEVLKKILLDLSKKGQVVLFVYFADSLNYIFTEINKDERFKNLEISAISSSGATNTTGNQRKHIVDKFRDKKIDILLSTDVLSEGQNLQNAQFLINYDLHWNPTRMIQRAGRIDRIGSPFDEIYVYNFFPEKELESLLNLVSILKNKINNINNTLGLDSSVLGEKINTKVFGVIRQIKKKDKNVWNIENDDLGGESLYQPLKDYLQDNAISEIEKIPNGIYSGLKREISGIFYYYKYDDDFHFWYLKKLNDQTLLKSKTEILEYIKCNKEEARVIPDFFDKLYETNKEILQDIENTYKTIEQQSLDDMQINWAKKKSTVFISKMVNTIYEEVDEHMEDFPSDIEIENKWEKIYQALRKMPLSKVKERDLRKIWKEYSENEIDLRTTLNKLEKVCKFSVDFELKDKEKIEAFDKNKLELITIDFIS
ncbi:MAG: phospholipase D-like domain-containing protein [Methanobrevibacter sp.]|nr:phospholipase D-like domain-containing protein [Candidatus Methanoflexus mossambicus]